MQGNSKRKTGNNKILFPCFRWLRKCLWPAMWKVFIVLDVQTTSSNVWQYVRTCIPPKHAVRRISNRVQTKTRMCHDTYAILLISGCNASQTFYRQPKSWYQISIWRRTFNLRLRSNLLRHTTHDYNTVLCHSKVELREQLSYDLPSLWPYSKHQENQFSCTAPPTILLDFDITIWYTSGVFSISRQPFIKQLHPRK